MDSDGEKEIMGGRKINDLEPSVVNSHHDKPSTSTLALLVSIYFSIFFDSLNFHIEYAPVNNLNRGISRMCIPIRLCTITNM